MARMGTQSKKIRGVNHKRTALAVIPGGTALPALAALPVLPALIELSILPSLSALSLPTWSALPKKNTEDAMLG